MWVWCAAAGAADTFESSALLAMGGVGAASSRENASLTLNPGLLGLDQRYDFQGQLRYGPFGALAGGLSAVDGRGSDVVAGGLAYAGDTAEPPLTEDELPGWVVPGGDIPNHRTSHDLSIGAGVPFAQRRVSVGLGTTIGWYRHDRSGSGWRFDLDAGLGARPVEALTIGVSARNFLPMRDEDRPAELLGGVRLDPTKSFAVEADVTFLPQSTAALPVNVAAGVSGEVQVVALRAGWRRDGEGGVHSVAAGLALLGPGSALEYGVSVPVTGAIALDRTLHQLTLRFAAPDPIPEPD